MSEFEIICMLGYFGLIVGDLIIISDLRIILNDFLVGKQNRKVARKIYQQQDMKNKITMTYIKDYIDNYLKDFDKYHRLYILELSSIVIQLFGFLILFALMENEKTKAILLMLYLVLKIIIHRIYSCKPFRGRAEGSRTIYDSKKR